MSRYRFALRPLWIASHLFVAACVIAFISLGFWQLRRLDERKTHNALIAAREQAPLAAVEQVVGPDADEATVDGVLYRRVSATGTYLAAEEVLIRNRTYEGAPGYQVITPLLLGDGDAVIINRGWIPLSYSDDPAQRAAFAPPLGKVTVTGLVAATEIREGLGVSDPPGDLPQLARIDIPRIQEQVDEHLLPVSVRLSTQDPAQAEQVPIPLPAPVLDEGPHLGYAGQWFIFAALTCIVYPLLLRRAARNKEQEAHEAAHAADGVDGVDGDLVGSMAGSSDDA